MAIFFFAENFQENNRMLKSAIKALELILASAGLITTLIILKGAMIPYSCELVFSSLMGFWSSIRCLLSSPLYICIIINFMIVLIALSSNFHTNSHDNDTSADLDEHYMHNFKSEPAPPLSPPREVTGATIPPPLQNQEVKITKTTTSKALHTRLQCFPKVLENSKEKSNIVSPKPSFSNWDLAQEAQELKKTTKSQNSASQYTEVKLEVENSHLDDKENEEEDTIEATWKLISGGGDQKTKRKELKKSETWVLPPRTNNSVEVQRLDLDEFLPSVKWKELRKSETFNDTVSIRRNGGLRRDPSVSLDEFNNQVEDFIKKFNADMRLQRQESDQRLLEMINQGL